MNSSRFELRPLTLGDILDRTLTLYQHNFSLLVGVVAVLAVPEAVLTWLVTTATGPIMTVHDQTAHWHTGGPLAGFAGMILVSALFQVLITGALARTISARYLGREQSVTGAYLGIGVRTFLKLFVASVLFTLFVSVGVIFFVIPGIYMAVMFAFFAQVIVLEPNARIFAGFSRSSALVRGSWWRVFGILLLIYIGIDLAEVIIAGVVDSAFRTEPVLATTLITVINILFKPVQLGAITLLYYDLRVRKEGLTIARLNGEMPASAPLTF